MTIEAPVVAIMQPYFLPYMGYFQLAGIADKFVIYDNIKYTKKGWINRNRLLANDKESIFSLPIQKASDSATIGERELAGSFDRAKLLNQFRGAYASAPAFAEFFPVLGAIVEFPDNNLFRFLRHSIEQVFDYLDIRAPLVTSSSLSVDPKEKGEKRVIATCFALGAKTYINPIGGLELYSTQAFETAGMALKFLRHIPRPYPQKSVEFIANLSIADVLMSVTREKAKNMIIRDYELI